MALSTFSYVKLIILAGVKCLMLNGLLSKELTPPVVKEF